MTEVPLDLDRLSKLRLVVARFGEMDGARWWNTSGQLATSGAAEAFRETFGTEVRELNAGAIVQELRKAVARHEDTVATARAIETEYARRFDDAMQARIDAYTKAFDRLSKTPGWSELPEEVQPYFGRGIDNTEQLDAALAGLREECARLIGAGKKVVLS